MTSITIRNLEEGLEDRLRQRAAHRNHSIEEEARDILRMVLDQDSGPGDNLADAIRRRIEPLGGVDLTLPPRGPMGEPPGLA
jgi:plasmid stability protein